MMTILLADEIKPLVKSLNFPRYLQQQQAYWEEEQRQRQAYYDWLEPGVKAEFINGEVVMQSPARDHHSEAMLYLAALLSTHVDRHELGIVRAETTLVTLTRNDYLPDVCFFGVEKARLIDRRQLKYPPPDFVVEVLSPSTADRDRGEKMLDYAAHGVQEYWLVDPEAQSVEQYGLAEGSFQLLLKLKTGNLSSLVVAGFTIPVEAIFDKGVKNEALARLLT